MITFVLFLATLHQDPAPGADVPIGQPLLLVEDGDALVLSPRKFWSFVVPRPFSMRSAGDLDGDGRDEWLLPDQNEAPCVLSISAGIVDVKDPKTLRWIAPAGDLDGDGRDDLVFGRENKITGGRSLGLYRAGVERHHAAVPASELKWIRP